ncbi:FecR family protein [Pedobacter nutrimenti]|uniref:FecR family protein n=1 Tax=Pedobacter nutrimenti TaxID=1241337 RepID=UPI002930A2A0|nr:FecR domain-containing protein [Pedobacter nutrimenti]
MNNEALLQLVERIAGGTATEDEIYRYNAWCDTFRGTEQEIPGLEEIKLWNLKQIQHSITPKSKFRFLNIKYIAAASILIVLSVGLFYFMVTKNEAVKNSLQVNDIRPGKNKATLTLASGQSIELSDTKSGLVIGSTELTYNDGSALTSTSISSQNNLSIAKNVQLMASTPRGGTYQLILPDGTKVWLNAASSLNFPSKFIGKQRIVTLKGEAYFEVAKDKVHPFIVQSKSQQVEVLGTHFNINSYEDEGAIKTTLMEGSVRVISKELKNNSEQKILKPGQQSSFANNTITIAEANTDEALAWKNNEFVFHDESIASIMRKISRWYDVDVVFEGVDPNEKFWGSISRFSNISKVLENLQLTGEIHFEIKDRKVYVQKENK